MPKINKHLSIPFKNYFVNVYDGAGFVNNDKTLKGMISFCDVLLVQSFWLNPNIAVQATSLNRPKDKRRSSGFRA